MMSGRAAPQMEAVMVAIRSFNILTIYYRFQTLFVLCITSDLILCDNDRMQSACSTYRM